MAWMTGKGISVGPGIIRISRACGTAHLIDSIGVSSSRRPSGAGLGEAALLAPDEVEIAQVDQEARALAQHEHRVLAVDRVDQQRGSPADREEPERNRDHALFLAFGGDPLDKKAAREERLTEKAHRQPEVLCGHHQRPIRGERADGLPARARIPTVHLTGDRTEPQGDSSWCEPSIGRWSTRSGAT